jgi:AraC-like DNA-binding protein/quercetin dioxygenase-like cupin family protein
MIKREPKQQTQTFHSTVERRGDQAVTFPKTPLADTFTVTHLYSLHYFEFAKDFIFEGERHDFWELLYVDQGELEVTADGAGYNLKQGDLVFHKPNEFHSVWANRKIGPNVIVISFECRSPAMKRFENKMFCLGDEERNLMAKIIQYGFETYKPPFDQPHVHDLVKREKTPFASEQLLRIHLELLLISLASRGDSLPETTRLSFTAKERGEEELLRRVIAYMREEVSSNLTLEAICMRFNIGQTLLGALFRKKIGMSVMRYYKSLKIEKAKLLIREGRHNFTEIAEELGYSSIHTFSRHFRQATNTTLSEYARTVKARIR